jgi:dihydroneopterin aldolase
MRFHALVGILPHERTIAQPIEIDLRVRVSDDDVVIDYRALYDLVASIMSSGPIDYLEQIARLVADGAIEHSPRIHSARVAVRKPHVALPGPLAYAEVVVERTADD